jgi:hypothetical protein
MTLTTEPGAPRATMSATAACIVKNGPRRFTATWRSNSSGVVSSSVPRSVSPAALTSASIRPCSATTAATDGAGLLRVGHVGGRRTGRRDRRRPPPRRRPGGR